MNILILEDDHERHKQFKQNLIGALVNIAETVEEAKEFLTKNGTGYYDLLFLDHDLGGLTMQPSGPNTGFEVAQWLSQNQEYKPESILLHSLNEEGRKNMKSLLPEAIEAPFAWALSEIVDGKLIYHPPYILPQ